MDFTKVSDSELINEMNKRFIIPNFYLQEHFDEMENWSEEKIARFKDFMHKFIGCDDTLTELMNNLITGFEEEDEEYEKKMTTEELCIKTFAPKEKKELEALLKIAEEVNWVGIKPYSHNIIGLTLGLLDNNYGYDREKINLVITTFGLNKKGWSIY